MKAIQGLIACGLFPHVELALHPDLAGKPAVVGAWGGRVLAASKPAAAAGVRAGMTMRNAEQLCPDAALVEPRPDDSARLLEHLHAALYDLSPTVEAQLEGIAWIDLEGLDAGMRKEAVRRFRHVLRETGHVEPRLGLAPGPFSARAAARRARPGRLVHVPDAPTFLAPLPTSELDLEPELRDRLELLGLRTLGQVAAIGPRRLESQLGPPGRLAVLLARGDEPVALQPWRPPRWTVAERELEPAVEDREALLFIARALCADVAVELGLRGAGARRLRLRLEVDGSPVPEERASLVRHPLSSAAELFGLAGSWLRDWTPAGPVSGIALEVPELEAAGRRQLRLWVGGDASSEEVEAALERLRDRHGDAVAVRLRPALPGSNVPSQRFAARPA